MSNTISHVDFEPKVVASGGTIQVVIDYESDQDDVIIVNEGPEFDAAPGMIEVKAGSGTRTATLTITRQAALPTPHCRIDFSLFPSTWSIIVGVV